MMKRFIKVIIIFILPLLVLAVTTEILLRKIPNDYSYKRHYLDQHSKKIKILFLGNSHVYYGINPKFIHAESFNAAYVSQSFNYDLEILERYKDNWDSLQYIVLALDYPSLYGRLENGSEAWRIKNYSIYYDMHTSNNIADQTEVCNNNLKMASTRISNYYIKHHSGITSSALGWGNDYNSKDKKDIVLTGKSAALRQKTYNSLTENIQSLQSIVSFARTKNIKLVFFTPPGYETYVQNLDNEKLHKAIRDAIEVTRLYPATTYVNMLNDTSFTKDDYYDADHLNEIGAGKLTLKIDSFIGTLSRQGWK
jgi:hypothetical protein